MWSKVTRWTRDPEANREARRLLWLVFALFIVVNVVSLAIDLIR